MRPALGFACALLVWRGHGMGLVSGWARHAASQSVTAKAWKDPLSTLSPWVEREDASVEGLEQQQIPPGKLGIGHGAVMSKGHSSTLFLLSVGPLEF